MDEIRKPYPQFNGFRTFVKNELDRRKTTYPSSINAPFTRLTSCLVEPNLKYMFFTLGLHGFDEGADFDIFAESYGRRRETVGYAYDMTKQENGKMSKKLISTDQLTLDDFTNIPSTTMNVSQSLFAVADRQSHIDTANTMYAGGAHPIPGITSVNVRLRGLGQPMVTDIEWKCYNRAQLEFLRHHFLTAGNYVVVEWGQQFSDKPIKKILDFSTDQNIRNVLVDSILKGRNYVIDQWVNPNDGNYNFVVGTIGNFDFDFEAATNTYTCRTTVVSVGEQIYGISMDTTFVKTFALNNSKEQSSVNTMRNFFMTGLKYDTLISQHSNDASLVATNYANWAKNNKNINEESSDLKNVSFNPEDYRFISWKFFTTILLPELYMLIDHPNARNDLLRIANFWIDESTLPTDPRLQDWIGDNDFLRSTEPDTMLIIKKNMTTVPAAFQGAGTFGDNTGYRGRLNTGVWLNTGMIRQCFIEAESFERGLTGVLLRMNSATVNFWGLRLFWDDEEGKFKIIDMKYTDTQGLPAFWKFNEDAKGEILRIKFESAFPPELVSQMMMYAKFKNENKMKKERLVQDYPMIGTTSTFMFSVNYTSFHDILGSDLDAKRGGQNLTALTDNIGARALDNPNATTKARVTNVGMNPAASAVTDGKTPIAGLNLGVASIKTSDALSSRNATVVNPVRSSVKPIAPTKVDVDTMYRGTDKLDPVFKTKLEALISKITQSGHKCQIIETYRSQERQDSLYQQGRGGNPGPAVTKTTHSNHTLGMAADLLIDGTFDKTTNFYPSLVQLCTQVGLQTIGAWDSGHVELKGLNGIPSAVWDRYVPGVNSSVENLPKSTVTDSSGHAVTPTATPTSQPVDQIGTEAGTEQKVESISVRFGPGMLPLIEPMASTMLNKITRHGFENFPKPNGFVGGFPTSATVTVTLVGLSGVSVSDGFYVDKLPFIFERHGVFQSTEITESITPEGWLTTIRGVFKLCWIDGSGHNLPPVTKK